jgi:hypothetical protein
MTSRVAALTTIPATDPQTARCCAGSNRPASRLTDLAAARMTKKSMGGLVDHLEAAGYVERVQDRADARQGHPPDPRGRHVAQAIADIGAQIESNGPARSAETAQAASEAMAAITA